MPNGNANQSGPGIARSQLAFLMCREEAPQLLMHILAKERLVLLVHQRRPKIWKS